VRGATHGNGVRSELGTVDAAFTRTPEDVREHPGMFKRLALLVCFLLPMSACSRSSVDSDLPEGDALCTAADIEQPTSRQAALNPSEPVQVAIPATAAGMSWEMHCSRDSPEGIIAESGYDVLDATIIEVSKHAATNGNPPVVKLQVHEVLSGDPTIDRRTATWSAMPLPVDTQDEETLRAIDRWRSELLASPKPGTRWILLGSPRPPVTGGYDISWLLRLKYSEESRRMAAKAIQWGGRLAAERNEYWNTWPERAVVDLPAGELRRTAQPVTSDSALQVRQPVLVDDGSVWSGHLTAARVLEVFEDGRVKVRPSQYNSRWDRIVPRDKLYLYPDRLLVEPPKERNKEHR
jgi:hypothetical protein